MRRGTQAQRNAKKYFRLTDAITAEEAASKNFHNMEAAIFQPGKLPVKAAKQAVAKIQAEAKHVEQVVERKDGPMPHAKNARSKMNTFGPMKEWRGGQRDTFWKSPGPPPTPPLRKLTAAGTLLAAYAGQPLPALPTIGTTTMFAKPSGANSTGDAVVNVPLQDAYDAAARYTQCLIDPWITPEGAHMPDDGECVAVGSIKNMPSFSLTFANGTVGCDGGMAWQVRGDTLKSYRIGAVAANGDVTWPNAWVNLITDDVKTNERYCRPICVGVKFILTEFGDPHMVRVSTYRTPPSSATSSTSSPVLNVAVGLTQAQKDDGRGVERKLGVANENGVVDMSFGVVTYKCFDNYSRHYWCDPATDRAEHSGEVVTGWAYGGRSTDQMLVVPVTHFEVLDRAGNSPLQSAVYASVRPSSQAHDVVGAVTDALTAAKMETSTDSDVRRNAVIESHVQQILSNQRHTSVAELILDKVQDWVLKPALNYLSGGLYGYLKGPKEIFVGQPMHSSLESPVTIEADDSKEDLSKSVILRATKILGSVKQ